MNDTDPEIEIPVKTEASRPALQIFGIVTFCFLLVGGGFFFMPENNFQTERENAIAQAEIDQITELASMAVMPGDTVEIDGQSVQDRNALIPIFGGPLETLNAKFHLAADDGAYKSALRCMTEAVYYEAANESAQGKRAVAQVILNRMRHAAYPNSVCGVVYEGSNRRVCQFSFTCDGSLLRRPMAPQWAESRAVAQAALAGQTEKSVGTSTHYHADYVLPYWAYKLAKVQVIGTHIFYRFHGRVGSSQSFGQRWSGLESIPSLDFSKMRQAIELAGSDALNSDEILPGVPIIRDVTDRRADSDVGGRIDPSKQWRLSIPDPVNASAGYQAKLKQQNSAQAKAPEQLAELDAKKLEPTSEF